MPAGGGKLSRLGSGRYGVRRTGDFSGRDVVSTIDGVSTGGGTARAVASLIIIAAGISVGRGSPVGSIVTGSAPAVGAGISVGRGTATGGTEFRFINKTTRLVVNGWGSRLAGPDFTRIPFLAAIGDGVSRGFGSAVGAGSVTSLAAAVSSSVGFGVSGEASVSTIQQTGVAYGQGFARGEASQSSTAIGVASGTGSTKADDVTGVAPVSGVGLSYGVGSVASIQKQLITGDGVSYGLSSSQSQGNPDTVYSGVSYGTSYSVAIVSQAIEATGVASGRSSSNVISVSSGGLSDDRRYRVLAEVRLYKVT